MTKPKSITFDLLRLVGPISNRSQFTQRVLICSVLCLATSVAHNHIAYGLVEKNSDPQTQDDANEPSDLDRFGQEIKAAVYEGTISEDDAIRVYTMLADAYTDSESTSDKAEYFAAVEAKLTALVQAGKLSPDAADRKMQDLHKQEDQNKKRSASGDFQSEAYFQSSDIDLFKSDLALDNEQSSLAKLLLNGFETTHGRWYRDSVAEVRSIKLQASERLRKHGFDADSRGTANRQISNLIDSRRDERLRNERAFIEGIKSLLSIEQAQRWPILERDIRRKRTIQNGTLSGESTDLVGISDRLYIGSHNSAATSQLFEEYAISLDAALRARNTHLVQSSQRLDDLLLANDFDSAASLIEQEAALRIRVRDVNVLFANAIAAHLDDEKATQFKNAFRHQSFPRVYRPTSTHEAFRLVQSWEMTEDHRQRIDKLEHSFLIEMDAVRSNMVSLIQELEPRRMVERIRNADSQKLKQESTGGNSLNTPLALSRTQRNDMVIRYRELLESVLTPDQVASLPVAKSRAQKKKWAVDKVHSSEKQEVTNQKHKKDK